MGLLLCDHCSSACDKEILKLHSEWLHVSGREVATK